MSEQPNEPKHASKRGALARFFAAVRLPKEVSAFEAAYSARMNRIALRFFYAHLPVFVIIAWVNQTGPASAAILTAAVLAIPTMARKACQSERTQSLILGFTAMCMGGVLVHIGQGPVQIEMHFYFFSLLAMLALFANPMVIVVAAATVAVHHLALWALLPRSVFNYDAPLWVVLVHAAFVVLETVAACFIARSFFDHVIGLERKVQARTAELAGRNRDMRLVLDSVKEGLVTLDSRGIMAPEHSGVLETWFGSPSKGEPFASFIGRSNASFGDWFELCWESIEDGFLPLELALDQLPSSFVHDGRHFAIGYHPTTDEEGALSTLLIVISDVTSDVEREVADAQQRETLVAFQRILSDRSGFEEFSQESQRLVEEARASLPSDRDLAQRAVHTLKGNTAIFGLETVADLCHLLEDALAENEPAKVEASLEDLEARWRELSTTFHELLDDGQGGGFVITEQEFEHILGLASKEADHAEIQRGLLSLRFESMDVRLSRFAEQARGLAQRLGKGDLEVEVSGGDVKVEPQSLAEFWSAFVHVVRNAVDHGIEEPTVREELGKASTPRIELSSRQESDQLVVEIGDDGRGIDWDAVRSRAERFGLPANDPRDLEDALFHDGLSTCDEVRETSGRGVGMAAVRSACEALGGAVEVESELGHGTRIRFQIPLASVTSPEQNRCVDAA